MTNPFDTTRRLTEAAETLKAATDKAYTEMYATQELEHLVRDLEAKEAQAEAAALAALPAQGLPGELPDALVDACVQLHDIRGKLAEARSEQPEARESLKHAEADMLKCRVDWELAQTLALLAAQG